MSEPQKKLRFFVRSEGTDDISAYCGDTVDEAVKATSHVIKSELEQLQLGVDEIELTLETKMMTDEEVKSLPQY